MPRSLDTPCGPVTLRRAYYHCPDCGGHVPWDRVLGLEGSRNKTGPFSTVGGALVMNMLRCEVAQRLVDRGIEPVFLPSHQFVGSRTVEEELEYFYGQYAKRVAPLYARQGR